LLIGEGDQLFGSVGDHGRAEGVAQARIACGANAGELLVAAQCGSASRAGIGATAATSTAACITAAPAAATTASAAEVAPDRSGEIQLAGGSGGGVECLGQAFERSAATLILGRHPPIEFRIVEGVEV